MTIRSRQRTEKTYAHAVRAGTARNDHTADAGQLPGQKALILKNSVKG